MADILLTAFNARYAHASFGSRCLLANLGALRTRAELLEFDLQVAPRTAVEQILAHDPAIVAIGCYIWNIDLVTRVAAQLKAVRPDIRLVLGGPEISYETEEQAVFGFADHVVCGEGEHAFPALCRALLDPSGELPRMLCAEPVDVAKVVLPYNEYTDEDIAHRAIYVEAVRGCPFRCEYCMSSLDSSVRRFPLAPFLAAMDRLLERGARVFRFVDRSFNLDIPFALAILAFFRERHVPGLMLHFEVVPDRLPDELLEAVRRCPPGMLQFEVGIQTFDTEVAQRIRRPLDCDRIEAHLRRLRAETAVHIHADLIAGLPGETLEGFARGFDRLLALDPQEIQLGILKRLRGAPIGRHTRAWGMVYSPFPPYEVLQTDAISFAQMQRLQRFARYWNLIVNNGHFQHAAPLIWRGASSSFAAFMAFSDWLYAATGTTGHLNLVRLSRLLFDYLTTERKEPEPLVGERLWQDYRFGNRPDVPGFLKRFATEETNEPPISPVAGLPRQRRHAKEKR